MEFLKPLLITLGAALASGMVLGAIVGKVIVGIKYKKSSMPVWLQLVCWGLALAGIGLILCAVFYKPSPAEDVLPDDSMRVEEVNPDLPADGDVVLNRDDLSKEDSEESLQDNDGGTDSDEQPIAPDEEVAFIMQRT